MLTHLLFMRHAKSSWDDPELHDHQRPLNKRGRKSADAIGATLHARGYAPELIWASDSTRTRETATRLIRVIPGAQMINYDPGFYHAGPDDVLKICAQRGEPDVQRLMLLGHNPGWSSLYEIFTGRSHRYPTGTCSVFKRKNDGDWLNPESWTAIDLLLPRQLLAP